MNLEQTKTELRKLISEVNSDNFSEYYNKIGNVVREYRDSGGLGKPIQDFLSELNKEFEDVDDWKEEHIIDIGNRIVGFAPPFRRIDFPDYNEEKRTWTSVDKNNLSQERGIKLDENAESVSDELPAFISKPDGSPNYYGFPLIASTETEGWIYGAITKFITVEGCDSGDGYIQAPDGTRAGLVWEVGTFKTEVIIEPEKDRWGVYSIAFPRVINSEQDLIFNFQSVLPELQSIYAKLKAANSR